jgi:hypothetical protein
LATRCSSSGSWACPATYWRYTAGPDGERNVFASSGPVADLLERLAVFAAEAAGN